MTMATVMGASPMETPSICWFILLRARGSCRRDWNAWPLLFEHRHVHRDDADVALETGQAGGDVGIGLLAQLGGDGGLVGFGGRAGFARLGHGFAGIPLGTFLRHHGARQRGQGRRREQQGEFLPVFIRSHLNCGTLYQNRRFRGVCRCRASRTKRSRLPAAFTQVNREFLLGLWHLTTTTVPGQQRQGLLLEHSRRYHRRAINRPHGRPWLFRYREGEYPLVTEWYQRVQRGPRHSDILFWHAHVGIPPSGACPFRNLSTYDK